MTIDHNVDHIAILVCDTPIEGISSKYGDFGDNVKDLLTAINDYPLPYITQRYDIATSDINPSQEIINELKSTYDRLRAGIVFGYIKGIILTGSRADCFANDILWINLLDTFIQQVLNNLCNFPIVGICFGHQILAKNLGAKVGRNGDIGWELGITTVEINSDIYNIPNSPFVGPLNKEIGHINIVESHQDIVHNVPITQTTRFITLGSTSKCTVQGLLTADGPLKLLTFQGHPEFTTPLALDLLISDRNNGIITDYELDKYTYNTNNLNNQGQLLAKVINNFLTIHK
ncbi:class I glutamine amidotransferase-like protein [Scheffersomyces amazonensis]|uniref:class I glutamine amidotransferase-like protein n=1 Tax=Scheffersomyces amazonensis TaxID=1078765 RepID=UPI00315D9B6B